MRLLALFSRVFCPNDSLHKDPANRLMPTQEPKDRKDYKTLREDKRNACLRGISDGVIVMSREWSDR